MSAGPYAGGDDAEVTCAGSVIWKR
jgi:hypothetical protein